MTALTNSEIQEMPSKSINISKGRPTRDISMVSLEMLDAMLMLLNRKYSKLLDFSV